MPIEGIFGGALFSLCRTGVMATANCTDEWKPTVGEKHNCVRLVLFHSALPQRWTFASPPEHTLNPEDLWPTLISPGFELAVRATLGPFLLESNAFGGYRIYRMNPYDAPIT